MAPARHQLPRLHSPFIREEFSGSWKSDIHLTPAFKEICKNMQTWISCITQQYAVLQTYCSLGMLPDSRWVSLMYMWPRMYVCTFTVPGYVLRFNEHDSKKIKTDLRNIKHTV